MRVLLDTNIIIHREAQHVVNPEIGKLFGWIDKLGYAKYVHQLTIDEIEGHKDSQIVESMQTKLESYILLKTQAPITPEIQQIMHEDKDQNDNNDSLLLNELLNDRVDILITEDKDIHRKARILNISDQVFTINQLLEKVTIENPDLVDYRILSVKKEFVGNIAIDDTFFDSFRDDYHGFNMWFNRKANEIAYICRSDDKLLAFLYLKIEGSDEVYSDIEPVFSRGKRLKIGIFKTVLNGFKLSERFLKIIFDNALRFKVEEIYVTIFKKRLDQELLVNFLENWGFHRHGTKTTISGTEEVYVRDFRPTIDADNPKITYPYISANTNIFIVPIYPEYHTELFPDSILRTESQNDFVENEPHRNAIQKVYISWAHERNLKCGDIILFRRLKDGDKPARYSSVLSTIGLVEDVITDIKDEAHFIRLCRGRSLFSNDELREWWNRHGGYKPFIINFLYAYSLPKRPILNDLLDIGIYSDIRNMPRGFTKITKQQFKAIIKEAQVDSSIIVN